MISKVVSLNTFAAANVRKNPWFSVCLCNCITSQVIMLESFSNPQKTGKSSSQHLKKIFLVLCFGFFVSDVIS